MLDTSVLFYILQDGYWGFGEDSLTGCKQCDCDMGGSVSNNCDKLTGQCHCRPNVVGKRCNEPAPGYFAPDLDHILFEAEEADIIGVSNLLI